MAYVVVIDDSEFALEFIQEMLESLGHHTSTTTSPPQFLDLLQQTAKPDLALVDEIMPDVEGSQIVNWIRGSGDSYLENLPVVLVSANVSHHQPEPPLWFLPKPFSREELSQVIQQAVAFNSSKR